MEGLASNRDGSSEGARSVSMTGEEVERWGQGTYDCRLGRLRLVYIWQDVRGATAMPLVPRRFWDNDEHHLTGRGGREVTTPTP